MYCSITMRYDPGWLKKAFCWMGMVRAATIPHPLADLGLQFQADGFGQSLSLGEEGMKAHIAVLIAEIRRMVDSKQEVIDRIGIYYLKIPE